MSLHYQKAQEYISRGLSVIPVGTNKRPSLKSWKKYQEELASDLDIEQWFSKDQNIGIVTGSISGITVVDIDVKGDVVVSVDKFPETYTVKTPSGGYHLYYQYTPEIKQTANTFPHLPHVDIRNDGGYVVAPPSQTDKGVYEIVKNIPYAPFPISMFNPVFMKKIAGVLKGMNILMEGDGRNNALTRITGKVLQLTEYQDFETVAYPIITGANLQFKQPLPEPEVRAIFDSISSKEQKKQKENEYLLKTDKGVVVTNEENVYRVLKNDPLLSQKFRYNTFKYEVETCFDTEWQPLQRYDIVNVRLYLQRTYPFLSKVAHASVEDTILRIANDHKVSPPVEWMDSLVWDETPRLDAWLSEVYNVPKNVYHERVGANWLKGLVKRLVYPGCKFDYVLVLEGTQGIGKSTSLAMLAKEWYVETTFAPDNKDFFMIFSGKAVVEFSEGETLSRTEAKHLKAVITMQMDKYRPPYERAPKEFPRQCVFAMTTNQDEYLKDETGNRRWLPVACRGPINLKWLEENREQLFAEAYHRVITLKETTYEFPQESLAQEQEMRRIADPYEEIVYDWYFKKLGSREREEGITTRQAWLYAVNGGVTYGKDMNKMEAMRLGGILRSQLKLERKQKRIGYDRDYRYYPSEATIEMGPSDIRVEMTVFDKEAKEF